MTLTSILKNKFQNLCSFYTINFFKLYQCELVLFYNNFIDNLLILFTYMFVYNFSLLILFWFLQQIVNTNFKTLFAFNDLKFNFFFLSLITIMFFSLAGVPPFLGFFSKLLILISLLNSNFFFFYILFFALLFFGLYFYLQNIRFLYSTINKQLNYSSDSTIRISTLSLYWLSFIIIILIIGVFLLDDLLLYFYWTLI